VVAAVVGLKVRSYEIGLFAGLIFLGSSVVATWVPYQRVDSLAVLLAVGAYAAAELARRGLLVSAILLAIGSLVKQTVALAALPILVYLLLARRYRDAAIFAAAVSLAGVALWSAVVYASEGFFLTAAVQANLNQASWWHGLRLVCGFLQSPLALAGVITAAWLVKNSPGEALGSLYWIAFVMQTAIAATAVSKEGASINYFLEPCALAAIVVGLQGVPRLWPARPGHRLAALGLLSVVVAVPGVGDFPAKADAARRVATAHPGMEGLLAHLGSEDHRKTGAPAVLADGIWIDAVLRAGGRPLVNDPFVLRLMVDNGTLQATALVEAIRRGEVELLLLSRSIEDHRRRIGHDVQRWPVEVLDAMQDHYVAIAEEGGIHVYGHRKRNWDVLETFDQSCTK